MNPTIDHLGNQRWFDEDGLLHRLDGPAFIGGGVLTVQRYYYHGWWHRLDGPATIWANGWIQYWVMDTIPLTILDLIITEQEMIFQAELVPEVRYNSEPLRHAYRFSDPDELALAVLHYS